MTDEFELDISLGKYTIKPDSLSRPELIMLYGPYGGGKGVIYGTKIYTPKGTVAVEDLNIGDSVIGSDGFPTTVYGIWDRGVLPVYEVTFSDGSWVTVDGDHLWTVITSKGHTVTIPTRTLRDRLTGDARFHIPQVAPVQHSGRDLPIPPYMLGALLADGYLSGTSIQWTKNSQAIANAVAQSAHLGGWELYETTRGSARQWKFRGEESLRQTIINLGINVKSAGKFIPEDYFYATVDDRLALLNGLFDGDGRLSDSRKQPEYHTMSEQLASDVTRLAWSLGISAKMSYKPTSDGTWRVGIRGGFDPFLAAEWRGQVAQNTRDRDAARRLVSITPAGSDLVRCIAVTAPDQLYVTKDYIVTHNTWLAASASEVEGLYPMLIIDTEGSTTGTLKEFDPARIDIIRPKDQAPGKEWVFTNKILDGLLSKPTKYKTVVIDAFDVFFEWGLKHFYNEKPGDGFYKWNAIHEELTSPEGLVSRLKTASLLAILVVHEKREGGEDDGPTTADFMWQGQGKSKLGQFPDMVGYVTRNTNAGGQTVTTLHTQPTTRNNAKNRFGLPAKMIDPRMSTIYNLIESNKEDK